MPFSVGGRNMVRTMSYGRPITELLKLSPPDHSVRSTMGFCQVQKTIRMLIIVHYMVGNNAFSVGVEIWSEPCHMVVQLLTASSYHLLTTLYGQPWILPSAKTIRMLIIVHYMVGNNAFFGWGSKYGQNHVIWLSIL
jgi:hypothetical protein